VTRISEMIHKAALPTSAGRVPLIIDGDSTNYTFDLASALAPLEAATGSSVGLFANSATFDIPTGIVLVQTSGYSVVDKGSAIYVFDAAVNSAYVAAHPLSSFIYSDGRGFRLSLEQDINQEMLGAADSVSESSTVITALNALMLSKSFQGTGSVWPFQDLFYDRVEYGRDDFPISPNAGAANFTTPFFRGMYLGANHIGGGQTGFFMLHVNGAPNISSTNGNYTPLQTAGAALVNLGGTGLTMVTAKGAIFGHSCIAIAYPGATNLLNVTGGEIDIQVSAGASVADKTGLQICQLFADAVSGSVYDAALMFSNQAGAIGWTSLLTVSGANGQTPLKSSGSVFLCLDSPTFANGFDLSGATVTGSAFKSTGFSVDGSGRANITVRGNFANDAAAATGGVPVSELYRNGSAVQIRVS
jgi:hypothetical protein